MLRIEEVIRVKFECGYNITGAGAEPYISYVAVFDRAVQPYLVDLSTTSSTAVTAVATGATVPITLAANPSTIGSVGSTTTTTQPLAFVQGSYISVDTGPNTETTQIQVLSGLVAYVQLTLAHGVNGSYPVAIMGAEQQVRDIITRLDVIKAEMLNVAPKMAGIAQVDEIKVYASAKKASKGASLSKFDELVYQRLTARRDLCGAIGIPYLPDVRMSSTAAGYEIY